MPVIMGMLGHTFVQLANNIMVGQLGTAELAAVSLGNSFVFITMSLGIGFSTAITPLVAEADGAGWKADGKSALKHGLVLCAVLGLALFGVILLTGRSASAILLYIRFDFLTKKLMGPGELPPRSTGK